MTAHAPPGVEFRGISHSYGQRIVLSDVSLTLTEPRVGIIGANGSGKSTLARMINGLVVPAQGEVRVHGLDPRHQVREVRQKVGFVFTDPDSQIIMPLVREDLAFSLRRLRLTAPELEDRVQLQARRFGLDQHLDHPAHYLSGGQKQLLALASIAMTEPEILVCDEPTTLLDAKNSALLWEHLMSLPQQLIVLTHHLELLEQFDRVIVLDQGRVVADASPAEAIHAYREVIGL